MFHFMTASTITIPSFHQEDQANGHMRIGIPALSTTSHGGRISAYSFKALSRFIFSLYWKPFKILKEVR
jgi:hypothetical protein